MKKIILFLFLAGNCISFGQTKYLIYFKDKGIESLGKVSQSNKIYQDAVRSLSQRAIERRKKVMGEDIIRYEDLPINEEYVKTLENLGIKILNRLNWFNAVSAYLTDGQVQEIVDQKFVDKVEKVKSYVIKNEDKSPVFINSLKKGTRTSSIIDYGTSAIQLALSNIPLVHRAGINGSGIIIGMLDSGFRWKVHESLINTKVLNEYDFVFQDSVTANQPGDDPGQDGHGTYVFSLIGGYKEGQVIGAAYGAQFILSKTEDIRSETHIEEDNYAAALEWMEGLGVDITSSSLGYTEFDKGQESYTYKNMDGKTTIVTKAANLAFERGVVTVTAAGNEGNTPWHYIGAPADAFNIIAVGAVNNKNKVASFSSFGPTYDGRIKPDITTMGVSDYGASVAAPDAYEFENGTSAATPIASGITGLLLSAYPYLTNVQVLNIVHLSGDNWATPDSTRGYGLLLADHAIEFPNIEEPSSGNFILHKAFLDTLGVLTGTAKIFLSNDGRNYISNNLDKDNGVFYRTSIAGYNSGQKVYFYFTYADANQVQKRQPESGVYQLEYGTKNISFGNIPAEEFTLIQNYPNPFNSSTTIVFNSADRAPAEIIIYNLLGQQVDNYNLVAESGLNYIKWNAVNSRGVKNSSGVYFYVLKIAGKTFTKKMVLLR